MNESDEALKKEQAELELELDEEMANQSRSSEEGKVEDVFAVLYNASEGVVKYQVLWTDCKSSWEPRCNIPDALYDEFAALHQEDIDAANELMKAAEKEKTVEKEEEKKPEEEEEVEMKHTPSRPISAASKSGSSGSGRRGRAAVGKRPGYVYLEHEEAVAREGAVELSSDDEFYGQKASDLKGEARQLFDPTHKNTKTELLLAENDLGPRCTRSRLKKVIGTSTLPSKIASLRGVAASASPAPASPSPRPPSPAGSERSEASPEEEEESPRKGRAGRGRGRGRGRKSVSVERKTVKTPAKKPPARASTARTPASATKKRGRPSKKELEERARAEEQQRARELLVAEADREKQRLEAVEKIAQKKKVAVKSEMTVEGEEEEAAPTLEQEQEKNSDEEMEEEEEVHTGRRRKRNRRRVASDDEEEDEEPIKDDVSQRSDDGDADEYEPPTDGDDNPLHGAWREEEEREADEMLEREYDIRWIPACASEETRDVHQLRKAGWAGLKTDIRKPPRADFDSICRMLAVGNLLGVKDALLRESVVRPTDVPARLQFGDMHSPILGNMSPLSKISEMPCCEAHLGCSISALLYELGADMDSRDPLSRTPLIKAVEYGKGKSCRVELLLERGVSVNARGSDGKSALDKAFEAGRNAEVYMLLWHGADYSRCITAPPKKRVTDTIQQHNKRVEDAIATSMKELLDGWEIVSAVTHPLMATVVDGQSCSFDFDWQPEKDSLPDSNHTIMLWVAMMDFINSNKYVAKFDGPTPLIQAPVLNHRNICNWPSQSADEELSLCMQQSAHPQVFIAPLECGPNTLELAMNMGFVNDRYVAAAQLFVMRHRADGERSAEGGEGEDGDENEPELNRCRSTIAYGGAPTRY